MLDFAETLRDQVRGCTREEFDGDARLQMTVAMLLLQIGEAARRVSPELRAAHPEVPWSKTVGMRNRIVHDYLRLDYDVIWSTAAADVPSLIAALRPILDALGGEPEDLP